MPKKKYPFENMFEYAKKCTNLWIRVIRRDLKNLLIFENMFEYAKKNIMQRRFYATI
jgi:hypothetical protein